MELLRVVVLLDNSENILAQALVKIVVSRDVEMGYMPLAIRELEVDGRGHRLVF
jgi:hypothetical protein